MNSHIHSLNNPPFVHYLPEASFPEEFDKLELLQSVLLHRRSPEAVVAARCDVAVGGVCSTLAVCPRRDGRGSASSREIVRLT